MRLKSAFLLGCAALLAGAAGAQPALQSAGSIRYASGGIGAGERDELVLMLPDHNLRIVAAAQKTGAFVSDVRFVALDAAGKKLLETTLDGPWLVARFPPGRYELQLTLGGVTQKRAVTIPAQGRRVEHVYWADPTATTLKSLEDDAKRGTAAPR